MNHERIDIFSSYGDYEHEDDWMERHYPIDFGSAVTEGRKRREEESRAAMRASGLHVEERENDDFWHTDPYFKEICNEKDFEAMDQVLSHLEEVQEEKYREFDRIHDAPLRHHKKVSST